MSMLIFFFICIVIAFITGLAIGSTHAWNESEKKHRAFTKGMREGYEDALNREQRKFEKESQRYEQHIKHLISRDLKK